MAQEVVRAVVWRRAHDPAFRARFERDPAQVLAGYDLTQEEALALLNSDDARLLAWGGSTTTPDPPAGRPVPAPEAGR